MRVLILANNDIGLYKFRHELILCLLEYNEVYISLPNGEYIRQLKEDGCKFIDTEFSRRGINPLADINLVRKYICIIKQVKPHIVLTYTIKPNVYGGLACRLTKTVYIANITGLGTSIENPGVVKKIALTLYKIGLKRAQCVFFQNEQNRDFFIINGIINSKKNAKVIPGSGVNLKEHCYEPYPSEEQGLRFLFIGRIMRDKGVEELFDAAERIKSKYSQTSFYLIGDSDEDYDDMIKKLGSKGIIRALGFQKDVHSHIAKSHCIILPSYHEGKANVLLESAACGRPVIASKVPGCLETYDEGITGLGCEVRNADSLFNQIENFITMSQLEHELMGRAGRKKMEREYDRSIVVNAYLEEINKIDISKGEIK